MSHNARFVVFNMYSVSALLGPFLYYSKFLSASVECIGACNHEAVHNFEKYFFKIWKIFSQILTCSFS